MVSKVNYGQKNHNSVWNLVPISYWKKWVFVIKFKKKLSRDREKKPHLNWWIAYSVF